MKTSQVFREINTEFAALEKGEFRSWAQIGRLLDLVDKSEYWGKTSDSFTEWLKAISPSLKLKEASLWRYFTAARYYLELRKTLVANNVSCPSLDKLSDEVSPENLEILSKLARVTPDDLYLRLAQQVVSGSITRAELRETWLAYRPVLAGKTSRGKGVAIPKINPADSYQFDSLLHAQVIMALSASGSKWTSIEHPDRYELFSQVSPELSLHVKQKFTFDAVAIVRDHKSDPIVLHVIEVKRSQSMSRAAHTMLEQKTLYCDFLWVATHAHVSGLDLECLPEHVGLMVAGENGIEVIRPAQHTEQSGRYTGELAKGLLIKVLGR